MMLGVHVQMLSEWLKQVAFSNKALAGAVENIVEH